MEQKKEGKVWLVGAGPSDAELLTLKAKRVLEHPPCPSPRGNRRLYAP